MTRMVRSALPRSEPLQGSSRRHQQGWSALRDIIVDMAAAAVLARASVSTRNSIFRPRHALGLKRLSLGGLKARVHS
jgi:hypothetical protein